jgi:hypothetical protein
MGRTRRLGLFGAMALAALLVLLSTAPASARVRVYIGGAFGYPYAYPAYAYPYYAYPPYPYGVTPAVPPPGWAPGHWEYRYDPYGRRYRAWVPPHLR